MAVVQVPFGSSGTYMTGLQPGVSYAQPQGAAPTGGMSGLAEGLSVAGGIMSIFGSINGAIGTYYAAESQKTQLQQQAQNQRFAAEMARINQRGAEFAAGQIGRAGQEQIGRYTMGYGQQRAGARASLAARGATLGQGTAAEIIGSMDVVKEIDVLSMNAANVRAQEAAKMQAFNLGTQALMADISGRNISATAGTIYPGLQLGTSLLTSAADIGGTWARNRRIEELLAGVSTQRF
jgi:hypothetical protein